MRKSSKLLALFLAVLMTVSAFPISVFAADNVITAVDMTGLVTETVFPTGRVTEPTFYATIPATVDGVETDLPVTWAIPEGYDGTTLGTYTFTAVTDGYTWECDAPTITAQVINASLKNSSSKYAFVCADGSTLHVVLKGNSGKTCVYDATGCNALTKTFSSALTYYAGSFGTSSPNTSGTTKVTVTDGANFVTLFAGGYNRSHTGDSEIDIYGLANVTNVYGGCGGTGYSVSGTATIKIHDLAEGSSFKYITRGYAGSAKIYLDDTSKYLLAESDGGSNGIKGCTTEGLGNSTEVYQ